jgi:hypothetical protein
MKEWVFYFLLPMRELGECRWEQNHSQVFSHPERVAVK